MKSCMSNIWSMVNYSIYGLGYCCGADEQRSNKVRSTSPQRLSSDSPRPSSELDSALRPGDASAHQSSAQPTPPPPYPPRCGQDADASAHRANVHTRIRPATRRRRRSRSTGPPGRGTAARDGREDRPQGWRGRWRRGRQGGPWGGGQEKRKVNESGREYGRARSNGKVNGNGKE